MGLPFCCLVVVPHQFVDIGNVVNHLDNIEVWITSWRTQMALPRKEFFLLNHHLAVVSHDAL